MTPVLWGAQEAVLSAAKGARAPAALHHQVLHGCLNPQLSSRPADPENIYAFAAVAESPPTTETPIQTATGSLVSLQSPRDTLDFESMYAFAEAAEYAAAHRSDFIGFVSPQPSSSPEDVHNVHSAAISADAASPSGSHPMPAKADAAAAARSQPAAAGTDSCAAAAHSRSAAAAAAAVAAVAAAIDPLSDQVDAYDAYSRFLG